MEYQSKNPNPTLRGQVIAHLHRKWLKKIGKESKMPFMAQKEIDVITDIILSIKPQRCLEWGSGYSTKLFAGLLEHKSSWLAIEHIRDWYDKLAALDLPSNANVLYVPPEIDSSINKSAGGNSDNFEAYVSAPKGVFDFILIDGRERNLCVNRSFDLIGPEGIVIVHDINRKRYRKNLDQYPFQFMLTDHRKKSGGLWIGSKSGKTMNMINLKRHAQLWKWHLSLLRLLRPFHTYKVGN
jgi:predicted O-methyltransferase YrrM